MTSLLNTECLVAVYFSLQGLGRLIYDNRKDLKSSVRLGVEQGDKEEALTIITRLGHGAQAEDSRLAGSSTGQALRRRATAGGEATAQGRAKSSREVKPFGSDVRNQFIAVPSPEVREAIKFFRMAVDHAIEVVNATGQVDLMMPRAT